MTIDKKPWFAVEAKSNDTNPSAHLYYFAEKLKLPYLSQVVKRDGVKTNGTKKGHISGISGPGQGISHLALSPVSSQSKRALRFPNTLKINQSIESMRQAMARKL